MSIDRSRTKKTKRWKIPDKFINGEFADFIYNINDLGKDERPIKDSYGSLEEWTNHYQLLELHGSDLGDILKLFNEKGCVKIVKKENYIQYHHQNMSYLEMEIRARIKEN